MSPPDGAVLENPHGARRDRRLYARLMGAARGPYEDAHVLACGMAAAAFDGDVAAGTGFDAAALAEIVARHFPGREDAFPRGGDPGPDAIEEPDLRALLLDHRNDGRPQTGWIARLIARRSLVAAHLWVAMGFESRPQLTATIARHFPALAAANDKNMRWKKFFYRELCAREGHVMCKSPVCADCADRAECFPA